MSFVGTEFCGDGAFTCTCIVPGKTNLTLLIGYPDASGALGQT